MAAAIALGATSMSDIALLAHLAPVLGAAPSGPTVRRALDLAGTPAVLDRIARARAKARAHAWALIAETAAGFHPLGAWCRNTRECLAMLLTPGNAGSNTFADHREVLAAALRQVPFRFRRRMITTADEDAIRLLPAGAKGLRWIVRRVKPSRRQMKNLTDYEKKTGWRYSIICTNIPDADIGGRTAKALRLRALPSKTWQVNAGWVIATNIAADLAAWTRLLGHCDSQDLRDADPDTFRYRIWHIPSQTRPPRPTANPCHQPRLALDRGLPHLLAPALRPAGTRLTSANHPSPQKGGPPPARSEPVRTRAHRGTPRTPRPEKNGHEAKKREQSQSVTSPQAA